MLFFFLFQIIEVLPTTDKAADFVNTLGHFYEIVEPKSDNARKLKSYASKILIF